MRLKIEVNTYEHFSEMGYVSSPFAVENAWFSGCASIKTYNLEELLGTKLRALYQRKKGRDLFDLAYAVEHCEVDFEAILRCWRKYMTWNGGAVPSAKEFLSNMEAKLALPDYSEDVRLVLRPETPFDVKNAYSMIRRMFIERI